MSIKDFYYLRKIKREKKRMRYKELLWSQLKPIQKRDNEIDKEKEELKIDKIEKQKVTWSKALLLFLFINFTILELFTGWVTIQSFSLAYAIGMMPDFTPLITLLGSIVGQTISYGVYCSKAKAENTSNGLIYEAAMYQMRQDENNGEGVG